jgi:hypothetical protein
MATSMLTPSAEATEGVPSERKQLVIDEALVNVAGVPAVGLPGVTRAAVCRLRSFACQNTLIPPPLVAMAAGAEKKFNRCGVES